MGTGENREQRFAAARQLQRLNRHQPSLIVPCRRVLGAVGSLTGYAGGTQRETALW
jgi:methylated-DNA-[protein]-cysteine S-methyltransferase